MAMLMQPQFIDADKPAKVGSHIAEISTVTETVKDNALTVTLILTVNEDDKAKQIVERLQFDHANPIVRAISRQKAVSYLIATLTGNITQWVAFTEGKEAFDFTALEGKQCHINVVAGGDNDEFRNVDLKEGPRSLQKGEFYKAPTGLTEKKPNLVKA